MRKKWIAALMTLSFLLVFTGCAQNKTPFEVVKSGATKVAQAESYEYAGSVNFKLDSKDAPDSESGAVMSMLSNVELKYSGINQVKAKQASINLELAIKGDMSFSIAIPIIIDNQDIYVKVPQIPMLPLPETIVGKYIHITAEDLKELSKDAPAQTIAPDVQKKLALDLATVFGKHFKDDKNLVSVSVKNAEGDVPKDVKQIVEYSITNDNFQQVVEKLAKEVVPDVLTVLAKPEYKDITGALDADMQQQYTDSMKTFDTDFAEFKKNVQINEAKTQIGINSSGYLSYFKEALNVVATDGDVKSNVTATIDMKMTNFNKETAAIQLPNKEDTVTFAELQEQFGTSLMQ